MTFQDEFERRAARRQDQGNGDASRDGGNPYNDDLAEDDARALDPRLRGDDKVRDAEFPDDEAPDDETRDSEASASSIRHDGWHPELRVKFLEALAQTGNVQASAYALKLRDPDFARAWLAALVLAREAAQDALQERAVEGVEEEVFYHGEVVATRRRYDSRLLLAHLARLDKVAEQISTQRGAARFGEMLDAIGAGEDTAPLIATPTEEELAVQAAEASPEEDDLEFYAITWPGEDGTPDYYRMTPEDAAEMERQVPVLIAKATGTNDDALICALVDRAEMPPTSPPWARWQRGKEKIHDTVNFVNFA